MGIDRIGKSAPPPAPLLDKTGAGPVAEPGRPFEVPAPATPSATPPTAQIDSPRTALDRWKAGEIDVKGYVNAKVDEATGHLTALPAAELDAIRGALRDRMATDPTLVDLMRTVTGHVPDPSGLQ